MDPASIIGLAGSVAGIVDIITRSISYLKDIHGRLKLASWTVTYLISHLTTLKAALSQVEGLISQGLATDLHYQVIIDLEASLRCCEDLATFPEDNISKLRWNDEDALKYESRVRVVLEDSATKDGTTHLNNQTSALNLLLTALTCRTVFQQKVLLEKKNSREVFDRIKDDSASLVVLRDSNSFFGKRTQQSDSMSKLSAEFAFDGLFLQSAAYRKAIRSIFRGQRPQKLVGHTEQNNVDQIAGPRWTQPTEPFFRNFQSCSYAGDRLGLLLYLAHANGMDTGFGMTALELQTQSSIQDCSIFLFCSMASLISQANSCYFSNDEKAKFMELCAMTGYRFGGERSPGFQSQRQNKSARHVEDFRLLTLSIWASPYFRSKLKETVTEDLFQSCKVLCDSLPHILSEDYHASSEHALCVLAVLYGAPTETEDFKFTNLQGILRPIMPKEYYYDAIVYLDLSEFPVLVVDDIHIDRPGPLGAHDHVDSRVFKRLREACDTPGKTPLLILRNRISVPETLGTSSSLSFISRHQSQLPLSSTPKALANIEAYLQERSDDRYTCLASLRIVPTEEYAAQMAHIFRRTAKRLQLIQSLEA